MIKDNMLKKIKELIVEGKTYPEIAMLLRVSRHAIASYAQKNGIKNPNYKNKITKHKHLHEQVLLYFKNHSHAETAEKFNLTISELKSCLTYAYKDQSLINIRKDIRNRNKWTGEEKIKLLRYSGILRREKIMNIVGRPGGSRVAKEHLSSMGVSSRNINGVNITNFVKLFNFEPRYRINGEAGPGKNKAMRFVIVPWFYVLECYEKIIGHNKEMAKIFGAYTMFTFFIWNGHPWEKMKKDKYVRDFIVQNTTTEPFNDLA